MLLPIIAMSSSFLSGCGGIARNNFAYDLDFNADVSGQTIQMWSGFGSDINDVIDELLKEFKRLTGINVKYESKSSYDGCLKAVTLAATSGKYPHIVVGYPDHFASYVKSRISVRLDYYFENDVYNPTFEPQGERFKIDDFYTDYMKENQSIEFDENGKPYTLGVPFNKSTEVLVYNKTFFNYCANQESLKDKIYVPATYDELETVGKNILAFFKDNGLYGKTLYNDGTTEAGSGKKVIIDLSKMMNPDDAKTSAEKKNAFKPFSYDSQANLFITTVRQNGGTYTEIDPQTRKGYLAFDSKETKDGINYLKKLYDENVFGIPEDWGEAKYGSNPFKANKTVMTLGSSAGVANDAPSGNKFEIGTAPVPYRTADKKYVISQGANLALLDRGTREERVAAWQLLKFLSKYANGYFCSKTGYYPSCPFAEIAGDDGTSGMWAHAEENDDYDGVDYATWLEEAKDSPSTTDQIKAETAEVNLNYYVKDGENWIKFVDPPFPGSASVREEVATIPPTVFYNRQTIDEAIEELYGNLHSYVRK